MHPSLLLPLLFGLPLTTAQSPHLPPSPHTPPPRVPLAGRLASSSTSCPTETSHCLGERGGPFCCPTGSFCVLKPHGFGGTEMGCCNSAIGASCLTMLGLETCAVEGFELCAEGRSTTCCAKKEQCRFVSGGNNSTVVVGGAEDMGGELAGAVSTELEVWDCGAEGGDQEFVDDKPREPAEATDGDDDDDDDDDGDDDEGGDGGSGVGRVSVKGTVVGLAGLLVAAAWLA